MRACVVLLGATRRSLALWILRAPSAQAAARERSCGGRVWHIDASSKTSRESLRSPHMRARPRRAAGRARARVVCVPVCVCAPVCARPPASGCAAMQNHSVM